MAQVAAEQQRIVLGNAALTSKGVADVSVLDPLLLPHQLTRAQAGCQVDLVVLVLH